MQKYQLEINNIFVEKGKLNIEATAKFEINPLATVPKIRLLFCGQGQTRRFPLPVQECTKEDGTKQDAEFMYSSEGIYLEDENAIGFIKYYKGGKYAFVAITRTSSSPEASVSGVVSAALFAVSSTESLVSVSPVSFSVFPQAAKANTITSASISERTFVNFIIRSSCVIHFCSYANYFNV